MPVFNTYTKIAKKQMPIMILYIVIFSAILSMFANLGKDSSTNYTSAKCKVAIFDNSNTEASAYLEKYLSEIHDIVEVENDKEVITDELYFQKIDYVLYIDKDYADTYKVENLKRPGTIAGTYVDAQIDNYIKSMRSLVAAGYSVDEAYDITIDALDKENIISLKGKTSEHSEIYFFFLYAPYVLLMMLFSILVPVSTTFNKKEVSDRMTVSQLSVRSINSQMLLGTAVLSAMVWAVVFALSLGYYKGDVFKGDNIFYIINSIVFTFVGVGVTTLVSSFNPSNSAENMIANIVTLGMCFLGGIFVPIEVLGGAVLKIAKFMPSYWYMTAHNEIEKNGFSNDVVYAILIELLFAITFLVVSFLVSKRKRINREN